MSERANVSCSNCGRPLPAADAICSYCEQAFSPAPVAGRHRCPRCGSHFEQALQAQWPPDAKWYRPQVLKPQCPHCHTFLRNKGLLPFTWVDSLVGVSLVVAVQVFRPPPGIALTGLLVLIAVQLLRWRQALSSVPSEEDRYAIEETVP